MWFNIKIKNRDQYSKRIKNFNKIKDLNAKISKIYINSATDASIETIEQNLLKIKI